MYFSLEKTNSARAKFNRESNGKFHWLTTLPWREFGIDDSDGINEQELLNLQNAVGAEADGLIGLSTLKSVQSFLKTKKGVFWNPITGELFDIDFDNPMGALLWNGLEIPMYDVHADNIHTYADPEGIDLHFTGSFSRKHRDINAVVVHWGGLNPQHLGRVFANRKASSHIAIGRSESTGAVGVYQYLDLSHTAWHAKGANKTSIGIDICQQPEIKHLGYYVGKGYNVETIENPAYPQYGASKIISLDPEIRQICSDVLVSLVEAFKIKDHYEPTSSGCVTQDAFSKGGVFSHFHTDFAGQGKWDVAPWWDSIIKDCIEPSC